MHRNIDASSSPEDLSGAWTVVTRSRSARINATTINGTRAHDATDSFDPEPLRAVCLREVASQI
jgi:hypothetical protein